MVSDAGMASRKNSFFNSGKFHPKLAALSIIWVEFPQRRRKCRAPTEQGTVSQRLQPEDGFSRAWSTGH